MSTRGADETTRHGPPPPPPAVVKIIETVHIEADSAEFKSIVQRLTGKDAVAGGRRPDRSSTGKADADEDQAQGFARKNP
uniref:VQ domain-containing protein n=6 Tax=Oryza TaxID=4527 RepID=A0A0D9YCJ1_9ORYZ